MEYFNEFILMMTMYSILCFTPFVGDLYTQFYMGYVTITIVCLHLIINLFMIFKSTFYEMKMKCKKKMMLKQSKQQRQIL